MTDHAGTVSFWLSEIGQLSPPLTSRVESTEDRNAPPQGQRSGGRQLKQKQSGEQWKRTPLQHYASWRPDMEVWLERHGAKGVHARVITPEQWKAIAKKVRDWESEATDAALEFFGIGDEPADGSASAPKKGSKKKKKVEQDAGQEPDEETTMRKELTALVERSTRVYGVLYGAMPEDLRKQAESVARGHASGLWKWLETKLQSTEQDSVGALLEQWVALKQEEEESFDSYRARVNRLRALLEHAKEKVSGNMYSLMLLDRLQPQYKVAVLALKAGGQLKDADQADGRRSRRCSTDTSEKS